MRIELDKAVAGGRCENPRRRHVLQLDLQLRFQNLVQRLAHLLARDSLVDVPHEERPLVLRRLYPSFPHNITTRAAEAVADLHAEHAHRRDQRLLPRLPLREVDKPVDVRLAGLLSDAWHTLLLRLLRPAVVQDLHLAHTPAVAEGARQLLRADPRWEVVHEHLVEGVGVGMLPGQRRVRLEGQHALSLLQRLLGYGGCAFSCGGCAFSRTSSVDCALSCVGCTTSTTNSCTTNTTNTTSIIDRTILQGLGGEELLDGYESAHSAEPTAVGVAEARDGLDSKHGLLHAPHVLQCGDRQKVGLPLTPPAHAYILLQRGLHEVRRLPADLAGGAHEGLEVVGAHGRGLVVGEPRHEQLVLRVAEQRGETKRQQQRALLLLLVALRVV